MIHISPAMSSAARCPANFLRDLIKDDRERRPDRGQDPDFQANDNAGIPGFE
jgi:hypothetical protein